MPYTTAEELLNNTDLALLHAQKGEVLRLREASQEAHSTLLLDGLINFLDTLTDHMSENKLGTTNP